MNLGEETPLWKWGKIASLVLLIILTAICTVPVFSAWPWSDNTQDIISGLRNGFSIATWEASDAQLRAYLHVDANRSFAKAVLKELRFGKQVEEFREGATNQLPPDISKETVKYLASSTVLGVLNWAVQSSTLLSFLSETTSVLFTISHGINIYLRFCDVLKAGEERPLLQLYFDSRRTGGPSDSFAEINQDYENTVELVIRLSKGLRGTGPVTEEDKQRFATYLEFCYQSWKLATDAERKEKIKSYILNEIAGSSPSLPEPTLEIDNAVTSQKPQLHTFHFTGAGYTPYATAIQHVLFPDGTEKKYSAKIPSNGQVSWDFTPQCTSPVGRYTVWITDPSRGDSNHVYETVLANPACKPSPSPLPSLPPTATILVMDVSGSMGWTWKGGVKIESAKKAALEFIEEVTHEAQTRGGQHKIGVVAFSDNASLLLPLTSDYNRAKRVIISLSATNATNLGAGLTTALAEMDKISNTAQRFMILLSDGETNTGLSRDQILSGPVVEARRKHICIHTVAFGDPGDIDKAFLQKVSYGSGCGSYNYASTPFELFATYIKLRHQSLGQVVGEYSSMGRRVTILPGIPISLGTIIIGSGKRELHYTLAWSAKGRLQIRLKDPSGRLVTSSYPGAYTYTTDQFTHLTLLSPKSGIWTVEAATGTSMPNGTEYYAIISTRPGGLAIPLPLPTFTIGNRTFGLPSGLPPQLLVLISIALIALAIYIKFNR